jgi:hypothetical protein
VQHKGKVPDTPRLPRIGLPRTVFYHNDLDKWQSAFAKPDEQIRSGSHHRLKKRT